MELRGRSKGYLLDRDAVRALLDENFLEIWTLYLEQNVARHKRMVQLASNPTRALIAQAIYWHELLLISETGTEAKYETVFSQINVNNEKHLKNYIRNKKLTASLVADLIAVPFETTRRNLREMCKLGLIEKSKSFGYLINKESEFHKGVTSDLNPLEKGNLCKLVTLLIKES